MNSETASFRYSDNGLYRFTFNHSHHHRYSIYACRCFFYTPAHFVIISYTPGITIRITQLVRSFFLPEDADVECIISSGIAFIKSSTSSDVSYSIYMHASTYAGYRRFRACFMQVTQKQMAIPNPQRSSCILVLCICHRFVDNVLTSIVCTVRSTYHIHRLLFTLHMHTAYRVKLTDDCVFLRVSMQPITDRTLRFHLGNSIFNAHLLKT